LSELRLAQHDVRSASVLIDRAFSMPDQDAGPPLWAVYRQRAEVRLAENRIPEAVDSFSVALQAARVWREEAAPSDPSGTSTDIGLHLLYGAFIEAAMRLPNPPLEKLFLASEEDRAAALRREVLSVRSGSRKDGFEYWEILARLRASEAQVVTNDTTQNRAQVDRVAFELNELEAQESVDAPRFDHYGAGQRFQPGITLAQVESRLRPEEALLSFYQGARRTYLWALTRHHVEFHALTDSPELAALAERFRRAVKEGAADRDELGARLYRELFGQVSGTIGAKPYWLVTADNMLFEIPLSALVIEQQGRRTYLMEAHSIQRLPTALMLAASPRQLGLAAFIGIGDGIYNTADSRWKGHKTVIVPLQLARLVASSRELRDCAHEWANDIGISPILLTGIYASRRGLEKVLSGRTAGVIHIASHLLWPHNRPDEALIDLGLNPSGESEVLTREDISHLRAPDALVIMSGCSSAATPSVPGAGVTGLVRAWMIAGAAAVIGSRWPTPDDSGELFQRFYRHLRTEPGIGSIRAIGDAMRSAQLDMLHSGTWRSDPSYWGAFYVLGKE
jgi:CHAT domain-containing protein